MIFKFAVLLALVAMAKAGVAPAAYGHALTHGLAGHALAGPALAGPLPAFRGAPVAYAAAPAVAKVAVAEEYDPHPQYSYSYSVADGLTGDQKGHQESRDGDVVQGSYTVADPDGTIRTVSYTADPVNGFNAVIDRQAPAVAKVAAAPVAYAAAPVAKVHAPLAYAAGGYHHAKVF